MSTGNVGGLRICGDLGSVPVRFECGRHFGMPCCETLEKEVSSAWLKFGKCRSGLSTSESLVERAFICSEG